MVWLYALILLLLAAALVVAYRVLGTPSRLAPRDYDVVLEDIATSVWQPMPGPQSAAPARPMTGRAGCSEVRAPRIRWYSRPPGA